MKSLSFAILSAFAAKKVASHATFQQLWVNGVDMGSQCARLPMSNNPVTNVAGADVRCNVGGRTPASAKCPAKPGDIITVEMHQQNGDRSCQNEAIGGSHYGPVMVYMSKVADAATADGSSDFFKIYQDSWSSNGGGSGDGDNWGTKDMNACCGKVDVPIPKDLPDGDYLLRAEAIALHALPAQLYMTCFQITLAGGSGTGTLPAGVKFPGAYKSSDPGISANIHMKLDSYIAPGPAVVSEGTTVTAGSGCSGGCQKTCKVGGSATVLEKIEAPTAAAGGAGAAAGGGAAGCQVAQWQQCGGVGYTGCTTCAPGLRCNSQSQYYMQCV